MTRSLRIANLIVVLAVSSALATIGDPAPDNPCPSTARFKGKGLAILDVSGDGALGPVIAPGVFGCTGTGGTLLGNFIWAETVITCTSKEKEKGTPPAPVTMDVAIEYFDAGGNLISGSLNVGATAFCGVVPGGTLTFHTDPSGAMPQLATAIPGFVGTTPVIPGAGVGAPAQCQVGSTGCFNHGSARILSTSTKIQCSAVRIDFTAACFGLGAPLASKKLTIIKSPAQKGD